MIKVTKNYNVVPLGILNDTDIGGGGDDPSGEKHLYTFSDFKVDKQDSVYNMCRALFDGGIKNGDVVIDDGFFSDLLKNYQITNEECIVSCIYSEQTNARILDCFFTSTNKVPYLFFCTVSEKDSEVSIRVPMTKQSLANNADIKPNETTGKCHWVFTLPEYVNPSIVQCKNSAGLVYNDIDYTIIENVVEVDVPSTTIIAAYDLILTAI